MGRIKDALLETGLEPRDFPLALAYHELVSVAFAAATWQACYALQPSLTAARPLGRALPPAARAKVSEAFSHALGLAEAQVAKQAWLTRLPVVRRAEPQRLVVSLAESLTMRGLLKPLTLVGKIWVSYEAVKFTKQQLRRLRKPVEAGGAGAVKRGGSPAK